MKLFRKKQKLQPPGSRQVVRSARQSAFSYSASRNEQEYTTGRGVPRDQDVRRRERLIRYWRQRIGVLIVGIVLIAGILNILHLNSNAKIISLTSGSNESFLQPTSVYARAAQQAFGSSLFNGNKITINSLAIQQQLERQFPELSQVSVTIPLMSHRPLVYIAPTTPSLILAGKSGSYILDNNGKALLEADQAASGIDTSNLPVVHDQAGLPLKKGALVLASSEVSFIQTVVYALQTKGVQLDTISLPSSAYELDVKPKGAGYFVKFNMHSGTARQQAGTFLAVQQRLTGQSVTPSSYIDVRLDGRAYYK